MSGITFVGSVAWADLDLAQKVQGYARNALSPNTWKSYENDLAHFHAFGGTIPASPEIVAHYLTAFAGTLAVSSLIRRLAAINKAHVMRGFSSPTKSETVRMVMRGIRREHYTNQTQAAPLMRDDLVTMMNHIPDGARGLRDRALLLVGFASACRRSELTALNVDDVEFVNEGVILHIRKSKTDQLGAGMKKSIPYAQGRHCPVKSLWAWMDCLSDNDKPLFRSIRKGGHIQPQRLSDGAVSCIIKEYVQKIGLDPQRYSGHSLRSGCISSLAQMNIPEWRIMRLSGHKSHQSMMGYIRGARMFEDHPLKTMF